MKILLGIAAAALVSLPAAPAQATLDDNCISYREFKDMTRDNMQDLERTVDARGKVVGSQQHGQYVRKQYRWCGHVSHDGFWQVFYSLSKSGEYMSQYITLYDFTSPVHHMP